MSTSIEEYENKTDELEKKLENEQKGWDDKISTYSKNLKGDIKKLHITDADITNSRQLVSSEIRKYALMIHKANRSRKPLYKKKYEFYSTKYQIVVKNGTDKMKLIESDIKAIDYRIDLLDSHIDYLRSTNDNLKQMGYSVKNRIELLHELGID